MDRVISYKYALGTGEQIRLGNFDKENFQRDPSQLVKKIIEQGTGLIVPRFIGIYQFHEIMPHTGNQEERELIKDLERNEERHQKSLNDLANLEIASSFGIKDNSHPGLIFVAYNPSIWTPDLVRESIGSRINRVIIAPFGEIPNFDGKDTTITETILEKGQRIFEVQQDRRKALEFVKPEVQIFQDQANLYGLTRQEYAFLNMVGRAENHPSLITGPELIKAIQELGLLDNK